MEAAGLAIGIVGIAGLFNTCLDSLARFQSYKSSYADSHVLDTRFRAARTRFEQWGTSVGISEGRLLPDHHHGLNDENTAGVIQDILQIISKTICDNGNTQQNLHHNERFAGILQSRRKRLRWALGGKEDRTEQVEIFEKLVEHLHNLVSVDNKDHKHYEEKKEDGWSDVRQILLNMEQGMKKFETWLSPENPTSPGLLWINGPAGFGKTVLCARIVQHLSRILTSPVSYFFFASDLGTRDAPYLALRSWIHQVADVHEDAFECVRRAWEAFPTEKASRRNLVDLFTEIVDVVPGCTFIADGLDECSQLGIDDSSLAQFLSDVIQTVTDSSAKLLFISRDEPEIRTALEENAPELFTEYRIIPDDVQSDTAAFSQFIVDKKLSNKSEDIRTAISDAMTRRCEGQFLWIRMQEETLRKGMSKKRLHEAVENTPPGLDRLYDHNWKRILEMSQWEKDRVFAMLRWAAFARRALSVYEITEAAIITQFEELDPDEYPDEFDNEYIRTEIVGLCGPLLEVKNMFVHIPHFSVRQYLGQHLPLPSWIHQNGQLQSSYEAYHHIVIARACLQYFNQSQVWQKSYNTNLAGRSLRRYAAGTWVKHVKDASWDDSVWELATELMREESPVWKLFSEYVSEAMNAECKKDGEPENHIPPSPLEYALNCEWKDMADRLITKTNVNRLGSNGSTPLTQACKANMPETVEKLLQAGADVMFAWEKTHTPLHLAVWDEYEEIVKILLSHGADPSAQDNSGRTPLHVASVKGNLKCCEHLIRSGADLAKKEFQGMTALHMACCETGHSEVARLILQTGPDGMVLEPCSAGPPLHFVCHTGDTEMAKVLIDHGCAASFTVVNPNGATAVMLAAVQGHTDLVKLLLDHGADTTLSTATKNDGLTLLHLACIMEDSEELMKVILRHGVEDSMFIVDSEERTPLHFAAYHGRTNAVKSIFEYKQENKRSLLDARTTKLHTPLWRAARNDHSEVVTVLLDHGAAETITATDVNGKTALWIASRGGSAGIVTELLDCGLEQHISLPAKSGDTPLSIAAHNDHVDVVTLLLSVPEVSVNHANNYGVTPLFSAARFGHIETVKILLSSPDIELDCENWKYLTPLHAAVANGHVEIAKLLIEHGAAIIAWPTSIGLTEDSLGPFRYFRREAPPDDAATVVCNVDFGYCDVCTLTVEDDKGYGCNKCWEEFWDEVLICSECFDREYDVCINEHTLVQRKKLDY
ncbi:ankyrin repeat-containing domain protein [Fusarium venenatum]|uniref:ankyrin repeat-containing domain protein n=1 Tax=Fusarium venenatum TaxID=56646 RepID=UPI001DFB1233|nr:ankyrin repeat-containing domain protein [Fusarium venenatum]